MRTRVIRTPKNLTIAAMIASLALAVSGVANAEEHIENRAMQQADAPAVAIDDLPPGQDVSDVVVELAGWVVATRDNAGYPFAILDKAAAQVLVFGPDGRLRGAAPALFGSAIGDHTIAGIAGMALRDIPARHRTTPAGRFIGGFGPSIGGGRTLWVDYDSAVAMHAMTQGVPAERRAERLASPTPDDNRITNGCINVSDEFFDAILKPTFEAGGLFYILPDRKPLNEVFPAFAESRGTSS